MLELFRGKIDRFAEPGRELAATIVAGGSAPELLLALMAYNLRGVLLVGESGRGWTICFCFSV